MEKKVCKHLRYFNKCNLKAKEPDGSFSDVYKVGCDLVRADEYFLSKEFNCFECSECSINPLINQSKSKIDLDDDPTIPCELEDNKKDYDVISTSSSIKPEDIPRLAEAFADGTYIPGVTENLGATSLDADGKSLLRYYSCRYGDIELLPHVRAVTDNDIVFDLVKWYPNMYFGQNDDYIIRGDTSVSKTNPGQSISTSLLYLKECNYVISFVHLVKGKSIEPVSNRPSELEGKDLQNYNRLKKIAKCIVGHIIDSEKAAGENNFITKRKEGDV